ncbi:hypothetical protein D3C73_1243320 [compost metagenome]
MKVLSLICGYLETLSWMVASVSSISFLASASLPRALPMMVVLSCHGVPKASSGCATTGAISLSFL